MAELTIDLPENLGEWLIRYSRENGRSVEDEVLHVLGMRYETEMTLAKIEELRAGMNNATPPTREFLEAAISEGRLERLEDLNG